MTIKIIEIPSVRRKGPKLWNHAVRPHVKAKAPTEPIRGHGLNSTKWKG
jgi:hypothetical protein